MVNTVLLNLCVNWFMTLYETFAVILVHGFSTQILYAFLEDENKSGFRLQFAGACTGIVYCVVNNCFWFSFPQ